MFLVSKTLLLLQTNTQLQSYTLFCKWEEILVRLDIWHFMWRLARGCTSKSHHLYGAFMPRLSSAIFGWDEEDYELLTSVKATPIDYSLLQKCTGMLVDQYPLKVFTCILQG